eukprot:scaffold181247_cov18-Prasinocladus_malaysianus.AAC.1
MSYSSRTVLRPTVLPRSSYLTRTLLHISHLSARTSSATCTAQQQGPSCEIQALRQSRSPGGEPCLLGVTEQL